MDPVSSPPPSATTSASTISEKCLKERLVGEKTTGVLRENHPIQTCCQISFTKTGFGRRISQMKDKLSSSFKRPILVKNVVFVLKFVASCEEENKLGDKSPLQYISILSFSSQDFQKRRKMLF